MGKLDQHLASGAALVEHSKVVSESSAEAENEDKKMEEETYLILDGHQKEVTQWSGKKVGYKTGGWQIKYLVGQVNWPLTRATHTSVARE